jgi:hypothetical protein
MKARRSTDCAAIAARLAIASLLVLAPGMACAPALDPDAFKKFEAAATELYDGADRALTRQSRWAQQRFEKSIQQSDIDTLTNRTVQMLLLDAVDDDPFGAQYPGPPFFVVTRSFHSAVNALNTALVDYATLLETLAGAGVVTREELDRRVTDINNGARAAGARLSPPPPPASVVIVSVAASRLLEQFIESHKRDLLARAVRENAGVVREACALLDSAMTLAATQVRSEYDERSFTLAGQITHTRTGSGHRRDLVKSLINLNDLYTAHLETLRTLHDVYARLPAAHAELGLFGSATSVEEIHRLYEDARRLSTGYDGKE